MEFEVNSIGEGIVLRLKEDIGTKNYRELEETLKTVYEYPDKKTLVVNLEEVGYINSLGLGVLCQFNRRAQEEGNVFKLASVSPEVMEIIEISQLVMFFDIYHSEEEALSSLEQS